MSKLFGNKEPVTDVVPREPIVVEMDPSRFARIGWLIVLFGIGGALLWAIFAPLDQGVPVSGNVAVSGSRKAVQHLSGGIVDDILVKEGDVVKKGQVLVRMNGVQTLAAADISRGQYFSFRATEARLLAERDGKSAITYPADILKARTDPRVQAAMDLQNQLFASRRSAFQNEMAAVDESINGIKLQITGITESRENKKAQLGFLKEQLVGMRDLAKDGYIPRNRLLEVERQAAQVAGAISEDTGNIGRSQRQISELSMRKLQRTQEYQRDVRALLTDVRKEAESLSSRLVSQDHDVENIDVKAPVAGTVVGMNVATKGGVVSPGMKLMEVVPADDPLVVEAMVPVHLIDKVKPGLKVELIFSAFNQAKTPHIPGIVTTVSADRMVEERTGQPFYKLKAQVAPEGLKLTKDLNIIPGMPVDLFIKTGERSMMSYMFKPFADRARSAMTEE